jgi:hypothetical protein
MILADVGPVYMKILLVPSKERIEFNRNYVLENIENFSFIKHELIIDDNELILIPLTFNFTKNDFKESLDYCYVTEFIKTENIKLIHVCCRISDLIQALFNNLFNLPLSKRLDNIHSIDLNISGIEYLSKILNKGFFDLPGQEIVNLNKVGHVLKEVTVKNYVSLKEDSLYPFLLANIAEGLSLYRVDSCKDFKRVGGEFSFLKKVGLLEQLHTGIL